MPPIASNYLPTLILGLAAGVYGLVQLLKRFLPGICGRHAVAVNVATSVAMVLVCPPMALDQVMTWHTVVLVLSAASAAGGFHGFVKTLIGKATAGQDQPQAPAAGRVVLPVLLAILMLPLLGGCKTITATAPPPLPANAVDTLDADSNRVLQAAHGFAERITTDALAGTITLSAGQRSTLRVLNSALNVADALEISYHQCGLARQRSNTLPACGAVALTGAITTAQKAFGDAELAMIPSAAK